MQSGLFAERYIYQPGTHRLGGIATRGWRGWDTASVLSDAVGNIVRMPRLGQALDLDYAANNRLVQVAKAGHVVGGYLYDANGLRAQKTTGNQTRQFIYDSKAQLLGDYSPAKQQQREYLWLEGTLVATLDTSAQGVSIHYVGTDFLGTPRRVVNTGGYPVWGWAYAGEAFGDTPALGSYDLSMRFPGQYHDSESGLNYNVHRDYDAATGRYVESDPIGLRGGNATFAYVNNNPIYFEDPTGTKAYASGPIDGQDNTIDCDGDGGAAIFLIPQSPCTDGCVVEHEHSHAIDAMRENPQVCINRPFATQIHIVPDGDRVQSEVRAYRIQLACLQKKLAELGDCDECKKTIEKAIGIQQRRLAGYEYWLKTHFY